MTPICVFLMKRNGEPYRWIVKITVKGERRYIGCYQNMADAILAWESAVRKLKQ